MQQSPQMSPMVLPSLPPTNITTEQIQKYLDENKKLILAILENENLGKLAECAQYQALLKNNLMYLAAIADAQPQQSTPGGTMTITPQTMAPLHQSPMQPPQSYFMLQQPQATAMTQQQVSSPFTPPPLTFGNPPHQYPQQAMQGHMGITRPMGLINNNDLQQHLTMNHLETLLGANNAVPSNDTRGGSKQDWTNVNQSGADVLDGSVKRHGCDGGG